LDADDGYAGDGDDLGVHATVDAWGQYYAAEPTGSIEQVVQGVRGMGGVLVVIQALELSLQSSMHVVEVIAVYLEQMEPGQYVTNFALEVRFQWIAL